MFSKMDVLSKKKVSRDSPVIPIYIDETTSGINTTNVTVVLNNPLAGDAVSNFIRLKTLVGL